VKQVLLFGRRPRQEAFAQFCLVLEGPIAAKVAAWDLAQDIADQLRTVRPTPK